MTRDQTARGSDPARDQTARGSGPARDQTARGSGPARDQTARGFGPARGAVAAVFALNGFIFGSLVARMPEVRDHAGISDGELGFALACVAAGSLLSMPASGALCARYGSRPVTRASFALACLAVALPPLAGSLPVLALTFLALGAGIGALDVAMNAHGVAVEQRYARPILSGFHAAFSFGGLAGAGSAAVAAALDASLKAHVAGVAAVALLAGLVWSRRFLPASADAAGEAEPVLTRPPRALWLLGALAFACLMAEGAAADWSAIYLHDDLGAASATAALAYFAFSAAMGTWRLVGDGIVTRVGTVAALRAGGMVAAVGFGGALLLAHPVAAMAGFVLLGSGLALVVPVVFRAASAVPGIPAGTGLAAVSTMGYLGFVVGPPLIGSLAHVAGLPAALGLLALIGVALALLAEQAA